MKMKRFWKLSTIAAVAVMTILPAFTSEDNFLNAGEPPASNSIRLDSYQRQMLENNNDFACDLFRTINEQKKGDGSIIVSPISVSYMLGMLERGADGETYQQIANVLRLGDSNEEVNRYFKKIIEEAPNVDSKVTVKIANCININSARNISLIPQYKTDMQKYYNAQVDVLDFRSSGSLYRINNWCKTNTNGMIPSILDRLEPNALMYMLNAVYFKATWTEKFDPNATRDMIFTKQDGTKVKSKMMHLKTKAAYGENALYKVLRLPYGNGGYSMYVLLPHKGTTINDVIQTLSAQRLKQLQKSELTTHEVDILMPRFTTASTTDLKGVLSSMGMPLAFNDCCAEFSKMAESRDNLYVSMMKQSAKIEVDEEGTKAAAVTVAEVKNRSAAPSQGYTFHATRPFVYYIAENSTGMILFMGTYCGD